MGTVVLAAFAAIAAGMLPAQTITFTGRRTSSAASSGNGSFRPSAQRFSIITFRPSKYPVSFSPSRNTRKRSAVTTLGHSALRTPTTGIDACCACAASGSGTTALPNSVMNSRRLILNLSPSMMRPEYQINDRVAQILLHRNARALPRTVVGQQEKKTDTRTEGRRRSPLSSRAVVIRSVGRLARNRARPGSNREEAWLRPQAIAFGGG
jgi:hypothetical protein